MTDANFEWHDGILREIRIFGSREIQVLCELYPDHAAPARMPIHFRCAKVKSSANIIDFVALLDNQRAGNISDGRIETRPDGSTALKLFLVDGYLEIIAGALHIEQPLQ